MTAQPEPLPQDIDAPPERDLPDLQLAVGAVLNLQLLSEKRGPRVQARVLGYLEGKSILAARPGACLLPTDLRLGDEVAVRYLVGRSVYGFKSRIIRVSTSPYPYFHLHYPEQVEKMEVRQSERVQVSVAARVQASAGEVESELRDLSASGAMVSAHRKLGQVGDAVRVSFELTFGDVTRNISTGAVIRSVTPMPEGEAEATFRYGMQFQGLDENDRIFLRGFVFEQLAARGGSSTVLAPAV